MNLENKAIISISDNENGRLIPAYATGDESFEISRLRYLYYKFLLSCIRFIVRIRLGYFGPKHSIDPMNDEVEKIYHREAMTYERKHHLTTNFRDTWWRRHLGMDVVTHWMRVNQNGIDSVKILDLATGVGLSVEEMARVCSASGTNFDITALDYNQKMLDEGNRHILLRMRAEKLLDDKKRKVSFVRGDARRLINNSNQDDNLQTFPKEYFDAVTIMFGAGGIDDPMAMFLEVLGVLKNGGIFDMLDIHRPIKGIKERWPFYIGEKNADVFAFLAWEYATKPLVLRALWGWRDPSFMFYVLPFVVREEKSRFWGFRTMSFKLNNEPWWLKLPVMKTGHIIVEKIEITKDEYTKRKFLLESM